MDREWTELASADTVFRRRLLRSAPDVVIGLEQPSDRLTTEWEDLALQLRTSPFERPGWVLHQHRAYEDADLEVMTARRSGTLVGVIPLTRPGKGRVRTVTNSPTPRASFVISDWTILADMLQAAARRISGYMEIPRLDAGSPNVGRALERARLSLAISSEISHANPYLSLPGEYSEVVARFSRNRRKKLNKTRRRLGERGQVSIEIVDGAAEVEEAYTQMLDLDATSWKGRQGDAIRERPQARRFYDSIVQWATEVGILRMAVLRLDERIVAADLLLESHGVVWAICGAYDEDYARYGPGILLIDGEVQWAIRQHASRFEFCGTEADYKLIWADRVCPVQYVRLFELSPRMVVRAGARVFGASVLRRGRQWLADRRSAMSTV